MFFKRSPKVEGKTLLTGKDLEAANFSIAASEIDVPDAKGYKRAVEILGNTKLAEGFIAELLRKNWGAVEGGVPDRELNDEVKRIIEEANREGKI